MSRTTLGAALSGMITALLLVSCASQSPGKPTAAGNASNSDTSTTSSDTSSSSSMSDSGAPPITQPALDVNKFENSMCTLLKANQLRSLNVSSAGTPSRGSSGPQCDWKADDRVKGIDFGAIVMKNSNGLDGLYENKSSYPVFKPGQVAGYPSVDSDITDAAHGACFTTVGTAKGAGFTITVTVYSPSLPDYKNPCSVSSKIAEIVVGNLKG